MAQKKQSTSAAVAPAPAASQPADSKWKYGQSFTFRLRRVKEPAQFNGLWNLDLLDEHGNFLKQISDADALNFCMENMMGELEEAGF